MPEYCTETDVRNRLTANGYLNLGDRDGDGIVNSGEVSAYVTSAIEWAGAEIDYALINHEPPYELATARSSGNVFLRSRAVDLATWQVSTHGGRDVPDAFQTSYDRAAEMLDGIRERGDEVPGLNNGTTTWGENVHETFEIQSRAVT
jgi:hypothetical protein